MHAVIEKLLRRLPLALDRTHREVVKLLLLVAAALVAFLGTHAFATASRQAALHDASEWYAVGERALAAGHVEDAIDAFRRATRKNRESRVYRLALARTLARSGQGPGAERILLGLREIAPEDPEIIPSTSCSSGCAKAEESFRSSVDRISAGSKDSSRSRVSSNHHLRVTLDREPRSRAGYAIVYVAAAFGFTGPGPLTPGASRPDLRRGRGFRRDPLASESSATRRARAIRLCPAGAQSRCATAVANRGSTSWDSHSST